MKHIILIGFKAVGKSAIGKKLAEKTGRRFVDLDTEIEKSYAKTSGENLSCRQIMKKHGQEYFRDLEKHLLKTALSEQESLIISPGGGAVLDADNRQLLSSHLLLHVVAPRSVVFERIMIHGRPAFFPADEDAYTAFSRLWNERMPIYESLAQVKVSNNAGLDQVTEECLTAIKQEI